MVVEMKTYDVTPELAGFSWSRSALRILLGVVVCIVIEMILGRLWPAVLSGYSIRDLTERMIVLITVALIMESFPSKISTTR